jgi:hypothetical protein
MNDKVGCSPILNRTTLVKQDWQGLAKIISGALDIVGEPKERQKETISVPYCGSIRVPDSTLWGKIISCMGKIRASCEGGFSPSKSHLHPAML